MSKPILCLDFDGVLHSYSSGWQGADVVSDPPVPGSKKFLEEAVEHFDVRVFSSRSHQRGGIPAMRDWMEVYYGSDLVGQIKFPVEKPPAFLTLDDRALLFTGEFGPAEALLSFKPWHQLPKGASDW